MPIQSINSPVVSELVRVLTISNLQVAYRGFRCMSDGVYVVEGWTVIRTFFVLLRKLEK